MNGREEVGEDRREHLKAERPLRNLAPEAGGVLVGDEPEEVGRRWGLV